MAIRTSRHSALLLLAAALATSLGLAKAIPSPSESSAPTLAFLAETAKPPETAADPVPATTLMAAEGPMISSVSPSAGLPGTQVTITGSNLAGITQVLFGENWAASFKVISDTEIQASVPDDAKPGPIQLVTSSGTVKSPDSFLVSYY